MLLFELLVLELDVEFVVLIEWILLLELFVLSGGRLSLFLILGRIFFVVLMMIFLGLVFVGDEGLGILFVFVCVDSVLRLNLVLMLLRL